MKNKIRRIAIVGLGLIGGSLAMALKINGYKIIGITKSSGTIDLALKRKAINEGFTQISKGALKDVDLVFLAPPLITITKYIKEISDLVKEELILSDVGSTKLEICNFAKNVLPENITFIGGHPMAGTERSGFSSSQLSLFKNCAWLLTPHDKNKKSSDALTKLKDLILQIGAKPVITSPELHDRAVALVSHLPLLASIGLCQIVQNINERELKDLSMMIASSGFRDTTRIGGGNPEMNSALISFNISQLIKLLPEYQKELEAIIHLAKENPLKLQQALNKTSEWLGHLYNQEGKNNFLIKELSGSQ